MAVHFVIKGKSGHGKTFLATRVAESLKSSGDKVCLTDEILKESDITSVLEKGEYKYYIWVICEGTKIDLRLFPDTVYLIKTKLIDFKV